MSAIHAIGVVNRNVRILIVDYLYRPREAKAQVVAAAAGGVPVAPARRTAVAGAAVPATAADDPAGA